MSRQKRRQRAEKNGFKKKNFKSKTSPSAVKRRTERWKAYYDLGRLYPRRHTRRAEIKARLTIELGLPPDTLFIFRWSRDSDHYTFERSPIMIKSGTVAVINAADLSLVLLVRCTKFNDLTPSDRAAFDEAILTTYKTARARWKCYTNRATKRLQEAGIFWGWMGCAGWRGGTDLDLSAAPYSLNDFTSSKVERIDDDRDRMAKFHKIRDFLAERFASLAFCIFISNLQLGFDANVPGFDDLEWQDTNNGRVFASNMAITADGFFNDPHQDGDYTRYAYGINCLIDRETGIPHQVEGSPSKGSICGAMFIIKEFDVVVDLDPLDGVYESVWDTKVEHYTSQSITYDEYGEEIHPTRCQITRYGSSCQISQTLVDRISLLEKNRDIKGMSSSQWEAYRRSRVKSYEQETAFKEIRAIALEGIRKEKAALKREAKLMALFKAPKNKARPTKN